MAAPRRRAPAAASAAVAAAATVLAVLAVLAAAAPRAAAARARALLGSERAGAADAADNGNGNSDGSGDADGKAAAAPPPFSSDWVDDTYIYYDYWSLDDYSYLFNYHEDAAPSPPPTFAKANKGWEDREFKVPEKMQAAVDKLLERKKREAERAAQAAGEGARDASKAAGVAGDAGEGDAGAAAVAPPPPAGAPPPGVDWEQELERNRCEAEDFEAAATAEVRQVFEAHTADVHLLATSQCTPPLPVAASARAADGADAENGVRFAPPIAVTGAHDSGGSAVAAVLRKLGVYVADDTSLDDYLDHDEELFEHLQMEDYLADMAGGDNFLWTTQLERSEMLPTVRKMVRDAYHDRYEGLAWAEDLDAVSDYTWGNALDMTCAFWRDTMRRVPADKRGAWGTKNAGTFMFFAGAHRSALGALSVVIVTRDPRDVFPFGGLDEAVAAPGAWGKAASSWARKNAEAIGWCLKHLPPGSCFLLRAEDLVYHPADTVARLRQWLGWRAGDGALPELSQATLDKIAEDSGAHRKSYGGSKWVRLLKDAPAFVAKRSLPSFEAAFRSVRGYSIALGYAGHPYETAAPAEEARAAADGLPESITAEDMAPTYLECALSSPLETFVELTRSCPFWLWNDEGACADDGSVIIGGERPSGVPP